MREVVQALLAQQAEAVMELQELRFAVHEIVQSLAALDCVARALASDVDRVRRSSTAPAPIVLAVHERATLVSTFAAQLLAALRELERGINGWN